MERRIHQDVGCLVHRIAAPETTGSQYEHIQPGGHKARRSLKGIKESSPIGHSAWSNRPLTVARTARYSAKMSVSGAGKP